MAILNKIRQKTIFLILIIGMALFAFVLSGLIENGGFVSRQGQNTIATINGKDIDRTEFAQKVENASRSFGASGSSLQAVNYVWNQEVRQAVFEEQFEELGIRVGEDQVNQLLGESLVKSSRADLFKYDQSWCWSNIKRRRNCLQNGERQCKHKVCTIAFF